MPQTPPRDTWLTRQEAAAYARVHPNTIDRWRREGRLKASRPSGRKHAGAVRIRLDHLRAAMEGVLVVLVLL